MSRLQPYVMPFQLVLFVFISIFALTQPAWAVTRLQNRSLFVYDPRPGVVTKYTVSFKYNTLTTIGSIDMLACDNPIPTEPCVAPPGLDLSGANLISQTGEVGYSISVQTPNHLVLSRTPSVVTPVQSSYTFDNVANPSNAGTFYIRLSDYASTDASGPLVDLGSLASSLSGAISIETQVPPILVFCVGQQVAEDCSAITGGNYTDMGELSPDVTLTANSQMAVGTNASGGFVITANGTTMQAGSAVIPALNAPTLSAPGNAQFGINLRANTEPGVGNDPDGPFTNAQPTPDYDVPNQFVFRDGDTVASAPNVSLVRRFTVSYIVNSPPNLRAGVYTTTITYICSGRF